MDQSEFIPWAKPDFWGKEKDYLIEALDSTWISGGAFLERFEKLVADYCGVQYAVASSNGTTSLQLAFHALGIKPGDEVIVPGFCFMAAPNMILNIGAKPVFADIDSQTYCTSAGFIEPLITSKTKAIVPVHPYGNICEMDEILELGARHHIPVIEDAAESFASRYKGIAAGSMGVMGSFSFQAAKTITTGEGGMVITNDENLAKKMALIRSHGLLRKKHYWHELAGYNFRLTNIQAAIGVAQMERIDTIIVERKRLFRDYQKFLDSERGVSLQEYGPNVDPVLWANALRLDPKAFPQGRDRVMEQMRELGIETRPGFYTPHQMSHLYGCPLLPNCDEVSKTVISLPTTPSLTTEKIGEISGKLLSLRV